MPTDSTTPVPLRLSRLERRVLLIPVALSVLAMAGWLLRIDLLLTFGTATAMQFNTAVGLLLCATSLALPARLTRLASLSGGAAGLLGLATVAQYVSGVPFGIDTLLLVPHLLPPSGVPGRMAWQTAVCLAVCGAATVALRLPLGDQVRSAVAGLAGSVILAVTLFVLSGGLIVKGGMLDWNAWTSVAMGTALSMVCLSAVLLGAAVRLHPRDRMVRWAPVAALVAIVTVGGLLWHWLSAAEARVTQAALADAARQIVDSTLTEIDTVQSAQRRMAVRWRAEGRTPDAVWDADARSYVTDLGFLSVWRIGVDGAVRATAREGATVSASLLHTVTRLCHAGRDLPTWKGHTITDTNSVYAIGVARLGHADVDDGCLIVATPWSEILSRVVPDGVPIAVAFSVAGQRRLIEGALPAPGASWLTRSLGRGTIDLSFAASPAFIAQHRTWTAELALFAFAVFGLLVAAVLRQSQIDGERQAALLAAAEVTSAARAQAAIVLENAGQGFWDWNIQTGAVSLDDTWHRLMGYTPGEIADAFGTWKASIHPDDAAAVAAILERHLASDDARYDIDYRAQKKDGSWTWMNTRGRVQARDAQGRALRMVGTIQDVSDRKRLHQITVDSLREKETLLREIHHRVKNNLAVMSSLFYFQAQVATDPAVVQVFQDSQNRARSMAMVHELLYQSTDLSRIDFGEYLQRLVGYLSDAHDTATATAVDVQPALLSVDAAVPGGLIVNELITNAFKHAFTGDTPGQVRVGLRLVDGRVVVTVTDNGVGMPDGIDPATSRTLGLRLVRSLADQLDGTVTFRAIRPGTEARLEFPVSQTSESLPPRGAEVGV